MGSFVNHSAHPNAELHAVRSELRRKVVLRSTKLIREGEEVTVSYGDRGSHSYEIAMGTGRYIWAKNGSHFGRSYRAMLCWDWELEPGDHDRELSVEGAKSLRAVIQAIADDSELCVVDVSVLWLNTRTIYCVCCWPTDSLDRLSPPVTVPRV